MLAYFWGFLLRYHFCPSSQCSLKYCVFKFFIFPDRKKKNADSHSSKNLTCLTTFWKYHSHVSVESFNVICWNRFNRCHFIHTQLIRASPRLWSIQSTSWFDWFFSFEFDLIAWLFGYPQTPLHKEKASFTLTC